MGDKLTQRSVLVDKTRKFCDYKIKKIKSFTLHKCTRLGCEKQ